MGCCISKYKPKPNKTQPQFPNHNVQDKHVLITHQQPPPPPNKISPYHCPNSPPSSNSSSSFTCTSSTVSCASSAILTPPKDRSFSNEFLWSCVKENPHIVRINSIKEASLGLSTTPIRSPLNHQSIPQRSTPQKRLRSTSPNPALVRNKSFRVVVRSPSPTRRFGNENVGLRVALKNNKSQVGTHRIGSKIDRSAALEAIEEDIDNPLISLDCFIFL